MAKKLFAANNSVSNSNKLNFISNFFAISLLSSFRVLVYTSIKN